jgi:predicted DNA-binding transcriptional regulator AlpA
MSKAFYHYKQRCDELERALADMTAERDHYFNLAEHYRCNTAQAEAKPSDLEKIPAASKRCGLSMSSIYRFIKAGELGPIVKVRKRASAIPSASVDAWLRRQRKATHNVEHNRRTAASSPGVRVDGPVGPQSKGD